MTICRILMRATLLHMLTFMHPLNYRIARKFGGDLNLAIWFEIVNIKSANINYWS